MYMNLLEFKRKLMTEPTADTADMRAARAKGGEFEQAAAESDRFEGLLHDALQVKAPAGLADQIILHQSLQPDHARWPRPRWLAVAAAIMLAVVLTSFNLVEQDAPGDFDDFVAWHWDLHGEARMQMAMNADQADPVEARQIFSSLGLDVSDELMGSMRLVKYCHDLQGAHIVMNSDQGPITLYYMPDEQTQSGSSLIQLPDGLLANAVNVERGSVALIAAPGIATAHRVDSISSQLSFPTGLTL
ncbi:MAG: DUF3379 family protein [Pseudomonadota bacterium]